MRSYVCPICGYVYEPLEGIPDSGIAPATPFSALPEDWVCPICGAEKDMFAPVGGKAEEADASAPASAAGKDDDMREMSALELSALCSNLARGCEKQYKAAEAALFGQLASHFKAGAAAIPDPSIQALVELIDSDLKEGFAAANAAASGQHDRGALRALTWSEKVSLILKSLLIRYGKEGPKMAENTNVFVCTICGFIYIGDNPPQLCPVCKVPGWKFEKIEEEKAHV